MKRELNYRRAFGVLVLLCIVYFLYVREAVRFSDWAPSLNHTSDTTENVVIGDLADLVNVFIGTTGGGHVFPGATVPHGMVKAGLDTDSPGNVCYGLITTLLFFDH